MFRRRAMLFYPVVVATFPVVFFYAENTREAVSLPEVLVSLGVVITGTLLVALLLRLFVKDSAKVGLVVSMLLVLLFSYGFVHDFLAARNQVSVVGVFIGQHRYLLPISLVITLVPVVLVLLYRRSPVLLLEAGTVAALFLVVFNSVQIALDTGGSRNAGPVGDQPFGKPLPSWPAADQLPDIYYIILDAYGRADVLQEVYGFDNSEFIDYLIGKGFYVAPESRSNYIHTGLSLGSSLNMRYLVEGEDPGWAVKENAVVSLLKSNGYQYIHVGSGWAITKRNKHADVEILGDVPLQLLLSDFSAGLLKHTIVASIADAFGKNLDSPFTGNYAKRFNDNMESLRQIPDAPGPTFTFNHNLQPHPPFVFDRNGNFRQESKFELAGSPRNDADLYIDQLIYVNKTVEGMVKDILERSPREPVIIIQGDHGPAFSGEGDFDNPSDRFVFERTGILNAYYLPKQCKPGPYSDITPVNTFRMVLDSCLGSEFGLLEDQTFWFRGKPPIDVALVGR